jgi:hypothetical protein
MNSRAHDRVLEVSACENGWNKRPRSALDMPIPVSMTSILMGQTSLSPVGGKMFESSCSTETLTSTDPLSVNYQARSQRNHRSGYMDVP